MKNWPYGVTDLKLVDGVYQTQQPHEDVHHPYYFEVLKDMDEYYERAIKKAFGL